MLGRGPPANSSRAPHYLLLEIAPIGKAVEPCGSMAFENENLPKMSFRSSKVTAITFTVMVFLL
jgi:hypothetical protein